MQQSNRYIIFMGISIGCVSGLYFLSLFFPVPFWITCLIIFASVAALGVWILPGKQPETAVPKTSLFSFLSIMAAIYLLSLDAYVLASKHGTWDAYGVWNVHAKYLADPANWRTLFLYTGFGHPDYPLCLPSTLAFFMRLSANDSSLLVPFAFHFLITLSIPVLIYSELAHKNIIVASAILLSFVFSLNDFYIQVGMYQYADMLLSFFFLCAFVCMKHGGDDRKYVVLSLLFLGCCAWTKNEGAILAIIFFLYYAPSYFNRQNFKASTIAIALPVILLLILKTTGKAENDMIAESGNESFGFLWQGDRYKTVYDHLIITMNVRLLWAKLGVLIYGVICVIEKKLPDRQMAILLTCFVAYFMIYVVTPKPLVWHLRTSQERLLFQLMPAMMYVIGHQMSRIQFAIGKPDDSETITAE